jgi:septal ring factor EnvC (AmiA/AmiB activator)
MVDTIKISNDIEVPIEALDKATKKEIARVKKLLANTEKREDRLRNKVYKQELEIDELKKEIRKFKKATAAFKAFKIALDEVQDKPTWP